MNILLPKNRRTLLALNRPRTMDGKTKLPCGVILGAMLLNSLFGGNK